MSLPHYQIWARGAQPPHENDSASRLATDAVVDIYHQPKFKLPRDASVFTIGSCFARSIEDAFVAKGFNVTSAGVPLQRDWYIGMRPSHVLTKFNTHSMLAELQRVFGGIELPDDGLVELREGLFWNPQLHCVAQLPRDEALAVKEAAARTVRKIAHANLVIITLGLTEYWFDTQLGVPINDTPVDWLYQRRTKRFEHRNTGFYETHLQAKALCDLIFEVAGPQVRIIVTVSPVPLLRSFSHQDVIVANAYSKSVLRAVAQEISNADDRIDYFPSYEIVTNSPRSVAWEADLRHVRYPTVEAIVAKFERHYFD